MKTLVKRLALLGLIVTLPAPAAAAQNVSTVWSHHIEAWQARNLEAIVADYADESVFILNNKIFLGRAEIRGVFRRLFAIFDAGNNRIDQPTVTDRIVFITRHFTPPGEDEFFGTDTFVIENGKIMVQTIASPLYQIGNFNGINMGQVPGDTGPVATFVATHPYFLKN